jgi:hypothetical protein
MIEKSYKCIIVQGANEVIQVCKTNIILCNFRPDIGLIFSKAIKAYLILKMNQIRKVGKLNLRTKQIMAIYLMVRLFLFSFQDSSTTSTQASIWCSIWNFSLQRNVHNYKS